MNRQIRTLGIAMLVLFVALFAQLNYLQVIRADELANHPGNNRVAVRDFSRPRGEIRTADGVVIARSVPVDTPFKRLREYPEGPLFAHITGFFSFTFGSDGIERTYGAELAGRSGDVRIRQLGNVLADEPQGAHVTLSVSKAVQEAAAGSLGSRRGAVVALDPRTGAVLALQSFPTYDPNPLSAHDQKAVRAAWEGLTNAEAKPMLPRTYRERYAPGSTFKVVTAAAAIERAGELAVKDYPVLRTLDLPQTDQDLPNFGGGSCGGMLPNLLRVSCNTGFAQMGLDVGAENLAAEARDFGFGSVPPIDLPAAARSLFPEAEAFDRDVPALAKSAIGQQDVTATPLQMALVAAGVANGGVVMEPQVMAEIRDPQGRLVRSADYASWQRAMSAENAALLRDMMVGVVASGSGTRAAVPGVTVAGKTGTAQTTGDNAHAWMIAFAPAEAPTVAVAVVVESQDGLTEATGGRVAAPIAQAVLSAALSQSQP
ncbi:MAG: penicillin-binding protein 2 [Actinobacteria bacterium]|nr:penicillin-binding protein 2 [Actinomycetota bacterium]